MKRLLLCALLVVAAAGPASAAGLNLSWVDCGAAGTLNRTFACDTNVGNHVLVGSFVAPAGLTQVTGIQATVDIDFVSPTVPAWWDFRTGGCRPTNHMIHSANFTAFPGTCLNYFGGAALGAGFVILPPNTPGPDRARIREGWSLLSGSPVIGPIAQDVEAYAFNVTILNTKTAGLGACAGCLTMATITFSDILITQTAGTPNGNKTLTNPANRAFVTWQDTTVPAKSRTWSSIKSLYR